MRNNAYTFAAGRLLALACTATLSSCQAPELGPEMQQPGSELGSLTFDGGVSGGDEDDGETGGRPEPVLDTPGTCSSDCDLWGQDDCGEDQKCAGTTCSPNSSILEAAHCVDLYGWQGVGEVCEFFGEPLEGLDDCERGARCVDRDPATNQGVCAEMCRGTNSQPICSEGRACQLGPQGIVYFCVEIMAPPPPCDPLAQDCEVAGEACVPDFNNQSFVCVESNGQGPAPRGTPCNTTTQCDAGLVCIAGDEVESLSCVGENGCCTPMCDTNGANVCEGGSEMCESYDFPGLDVGSCRLPDAP